jgi:hypothetical protein
MQGHRVLLYFAWSRPAEGGAPLFDIDDRFPALFELRRTFYPRFEELALAAQVDQGILGFLDHVQKPNFAGFAEHARLLTGQDVAQVERVDDHGILTALDTALLSRADTLIVISFDSLRTGVVAAPHEVAAVREFLADPQHLIAICPHHDIGEVEPAAGEPGAARLAEHLHHADPAIPPRQGFGGYARSLLSGLGLPVQNRFGLRPAVDPDGEPAPIEVRQSLDRLGLLRGVRNFNSHPHLPHLERSGVALDRLQVLATQRVAPTAAPHPFTRGGRWSFDALLQSTPAAFAGTVLVSDTTLWSSTAGGLASLRVFWSNVLQRARA